MSVQLEKKKILFKVHLKCRIKYIIRVFMGNVFVYHCIFSVLELIYKDLPPELLYFFCRN